MKKIRGKILIPIILLLAISLTLLGGLSTLLNYQSTHATLNQAMRETALIAADRVAHELW